MRATRAASTRATPAPHFPARWDGWQRMATRLLLGGGITAILPLRTAYDSAVVGCRYSWAARCMRARTDEYFIRARPSSRPPGDDLVKGSSDG